MQQTLHHSKGFLGGDFGAHGLCLCCSIPVRLQQVDQHLGCALRPDSCTQAMQLHSCCRCWAAVVFSRDCKVDQL